MLGHTVLYRPGLLLSFGEALREGLHRAAEEAGGVDRGIQKGRLLRILHIC